DTVLRLLRIRQRPVDKGLSLVASCVDQLDGLVDLDALPAECLQAVLETWPGPHTWVLPRGASAPSWISGTHPGIAVRISAHPVVAALCEACESAMVSTSANLTGQPPARRRHELDPALLDQLDGVIHGETGGSERPSTIVDALSGADLRS